MRLSQSLNLRDRTLAFFLSCALLTLLTLSSMRGQWDVALASTCGAGTNVGTVGTGTMTVPGGTGTGTGTGIGTGVPSTVTITISVSPSSVSANGVSSSSVSALVLRGTAGVSQAQVRFDTDLGTFTVSGGATETAVTNASGLATASILSSTAGAATVQATLLDGLGNPVACPTTAVAFTPSTPATITKVAGDPQIGPAGATLQPMVVLVKDDGGNPKAGVAVQFVASKGVLDSGSATKNAVTDTTGQAQATLTLSGGGAPPDSFSVSATCSTCTSATKSVTFTATTAPPDKVAKSGGDSQYGIAGTALTQPLSVVVVNANGTPLKGVTVTWTSSKGAFTTATTTTTDKDGEATASLTLGSADVSPATHTVTATCASCDTTKTVTFTATSLTAFPFSGSVRSFDVNGASLPAATAAGANIVITQSAFNLSFAAVVAAGGTFTANVAAADGTASVSKDGFQSTGALAISMSAAGVQNPASANARLTLVQQGVPITGTVTTQLGAAVANAFISANEVTTTGGRLAGARHVYGLSDGSGAYSIKVAPNSFWNIYAYASNQGERFVDLNGDKTADTVAAGTLGVSGQNIVFPATINLTGRVKKNGVAVAANAGVVYARGNSGAPNPGSAAIGAGGAYSLKLPVPATGSSSFTVNAVVDSEMLPREVRVNALGQCLNAAGGAVSCVQDFDTAVATLTVNFLTGGGTAYTVPHAFVSATSSTTVAGTNQSTPSGSTTVTNASVASLPLVGGDTALGVTSKTYRVLVTVSGFGVLSDTNVVIGAGIGAAAMTVTVTVPVPLTLTGTVKDGSGAALPSANIEVNSTTLGRTATTSATGAYRVDLPAGSASYRVTASKVGYLSSTQVITFPGTTTQDFTLTSDGGQNTISGTISGVPSNVSKHITAITSDGRQFSTDAGTTGTNCAATLVAGLNDFCMTVGAASIISLKATADGYVFASIDKTLPLSTATGSVSGVTITMTAVNTGRAQSGQCSNSAGCRIEAEGSRITVALPPAAGAADTWTVTIKETTDAPETATYKPVFLSADGVPLGVEITVVNSAGVQVTQFSTPLTFRIEPVVAGSLTGFFNGATGNWVPMDSCVNDATGTTCSTTHLTTFGMLSAGGSTPSATGGGTPSTGGTGGGGGGGGGTPVTLPPTPPGPSSTAPSTAGAVPVNAKDGTTIGVANGAQSDGGVSLSVPAGSLSGDTKLSLVLNQSEPKGITAPGGTSLLPFSIDVTNDNGTRLRTASHLFVNVAQGLLGGRNPARLQGGVVESDGSVTLLPSSLLDGSEQGVLDIRIEHFSTYVVVERTGGVPVLNGPMSGETLATLGATLAWTNPPGTVQYQIQVAPFNNDGPGVNLLRDAETSYTVMAPNFGGADANYVMLPGISYVWRVRTTTVAKPGEADWSAWSVGYFRTPTADPRAIDRVSPQALEKVGGLTPTLTWSNVDKQVFYYEVQVSKDAEFGPTAFLYWELVHGGASSPANSYTISSKFPLEAGLTYYWRVRPRAQGDAAETAWSATFIFQAP